MCLRELLAYREGVKLLDFSVDRLQQGEVAGDTTLGHSEKRIVIVQKEMELGVLGLYMIIKKEYCINIPYVYNSKFSITQCKCFRQNLNKHKVQIP